MFAGRAGNHRSKTDKLLNPKATPFLLILFLLYLITVGRIWNDEVITLLFSVM